MWSALPALFHMVHLTIQGAIEWQYMFSSQSIQKENMYSEVACIPCELIWLKMNRLLSVIDDTIYP